MVQSEHTDRRRMTMKKLVCLTLALTMLLGIFGTAAAEEAFMRYESDFSGG